MESRTLYSRQRFSWFAILGSLVFIPIGAWMIQYGYWLGRLEVFFFGLGLVVLTVPNLFKLHRLHLEPTGFQRFPGFGRPRLAWSEVKRFFLTADGQKVVYELVPNPDEIISEDPDEYFAYFPTTYSLSAAELLEVLNRYKQFADRLGVSTKSE
jgi:hypothetical protein